MDATAEEYFSKMKDADLLKWKDSYEVLLRDNAADSGKTGRTPWMGPAWANGLRIVNEEITKRKIGEVQLTIFS